MSVAELLVSERAAKLRLAFDRSFVEAQHFEPVATEDFLSVTVGGDPYVLRLSEVAGLYVDRKITRLPSKVAALRGLAGFRGAMVPVYDLAALFRYPPAEAPRWMVLAAAAPLALAFDAFGGHCRLPLAAVASRSDPDSRDHLRQIVRDADATRSIIHLPSIIAAVRKGLPDAARKEHE